MHPAQRRGVQPRSVERAALALHAPGAARRPAGAARSRRPTRPRPMSTTTSLLRVVEPAQRRTDLGRPSGRRSGRTGRSSDRAVTTTSRLRSARGRPHVPAAHAHYDASSRARAQCSTAAEPQCPSVGYVDPARRPRRARSASPRSTGSRGRCGATSATVGGPRRRPARRAPAPAPARMSWAHDRGAGQPFGRPRTTAWWPSVRMSAPSRASSWTNMNRASKTFSVIIAVPSPTAASAIANGCRSVGKPG